MQGEACQASTKCIGMYCVCACRCPIFLVPGKSEDEEDNKFIRWVQRARHLSSIMAQQAGVSVADEHKLRYEYAKLKAKGK